MIYVLEDDESIREPVSYTHLDVYKRQTQYKVFARLAFIDSR